MREGSTAFFSSLCVLSCELFAFVVLGWWGGAMLLTIQRDSSVQAIPSSDRVKDL